VSRLYVIGLLVVIAAAPAFGTNWFLNPDGSGDAPTIAAAIDSAESGDWIMLNGGIYYEEDILLDGKDVSFSYNLGIPYIQAAVPGTGTGITIRNVSNSSTFFGINFNFFDQAMIVEDGAPNIWFVNFNGCGSCINVSGGSSAPEMANMLVDSCTVGFEIAGGSGTEIINCTLVKTGKCILMSGGSASVLRNIFFLSDTGIECISGSATLDCNDFWRNDVNYAGCSAGVTDIYEDPMFCIFSISSPGLYYLNELSPCWAENNACNVDIGAYTTIAGCDTTDVEDSSWGFIKNIHR